MKLKLSDIANCCMCGRIVDTREVEDGGDKFGAQSAGGLWTCSFECWDESLNELAPGRQTLKGGGG